MDDIQKIVVGVLDIPHLQNMSKDELKAAMKTIEESPRPSNKQTYVYGMNEDGDYAVYLFDLPTAAKKDFSVTQRNILRKVFATPVTIGTRLIRSLMALMIHLNIKEAVLITPTAFEVYNDIFDKAISYTFDEIDKRFDPESGERISHVKAKFTEKDIKIQQVITLEGEDTNEDE